jgi:phenylpropionate dioxygenase-like ring-hydroxylating dioxygenase large terminal subunit
MNEMVAVERIQTQEELERCPMPIPFGWFCVGLSEELKPGEIKNVRMFGGEWVMFRGEDGSVGMTDPYCPHLGAHLGHGGEVVGNNIRCPFHHWEYDSQGWCKKIPYAKVMPGVTRRKPVLRALPIEEKYGAIFAWYHPQGAEPSYPLMSIPEFEEPGYVPITRGVWEIGTMMQEIGENSVDAPHLLYLHKSPQIPPSEYSVDGYKFRGNIGNGYITNESWGPGTGALRFTENGVTVTIFALSTPVERDLTRMRWLFTYRDYPEGSPERAIAEKLKTRSVGQVEGEEAAGFESVDIVIWHNKKYRPQPLLCDGDGPIFLWRNWFKQFYAEPVEA